MAAIVQHAENLQLAAPQTVHLASAATAGNVLVAWAVTRSPSLGAPINDPDGFADVSGSPVGDGLVTSSTPNAGHVQVWTMEAAGGEQDILFEGGNPSMDCGVFEIVAGSATPYDVVAVDNQSATTHPVLPGLTAPGGSQLILAVLLFTDQNNHTTLTPDASYTEYADEQVHGVNGPRGAVIGIDTTSGGTSYSPGWTALVPQKWAGIALTFEGEPPPDPEPGTGVDFDEDGFGTDDDDELGGYVMSWRIQRGAAAEITGGATIGNCTVVLKNTEDRFNPRNSGGPLYGKLRDGLPLWIGVNSDGAATGDDPRGLFGGYTKDWTPILVPGSSTGAAPTVELTGEDALAKYGRTKVRVPDQVGRSHAELRNELLQAAGETHVDLAHEIHTMPISSWDGTLLAALEAINEANGTRHFCKPANARADWYAYTTRNRQWRLDGTVDASLDAGDDHATGVTGMTLSADTVTNQQKATATPIYFTPSSTTVWEAEVLPFSFSGTKEIWAEFDDYVKDPALDVNFTGTTPSTAIEGFGSTAKITLTSAGTTTITGLSVEGALVRRGQDESYVADDTASQAGNRGVRAGSDLGPQFMGILANAKGIASHVVWRYGTPQLRPTITVENWLPYQFDIDLYDVIAFTVAQGAMSSVLFEVVGLTHGGVLAVSDTEHLHITTYVLQECRVQADPGWFVIDTSEIEGSDVLGY